MSIREPELPSDEPLTDRERALAKRYERFEAACYFADQTLGAIDPEICEQSLLLTESGGGVMHIYADVTVYFYASDDPKEIIRSCVAALRSAADAAERRL